MSESTLYLLAMLGTAGFGIVTWRVFSDIETIAKAVIKIQRRLDMDKQQDELAAQKELHKMP